jgi:CRISPR-associated protein Cas1
MTNLLNTLFVTTEGTGVRLEGTSLRIVVEKKTKAQVPLHHLSAVVCFPRVWMSPEAMAACAEAGAAVVFLDRTGRYLARVEGRKPGSAALRRLQYRAADDPPRRLALARGFVAGKIANTRTILRRAARTRQEPDGKARLDAAADRLRDLAKLVVDASDLDLLRGYEGEAASRFFDLLETAIGKPGFEFAKRTRRPPCDPINAMLSMGYGLLATDCQSAVQAAGLDPAVGYLHVERPGRPSLALDLMEELRPVVVDRLVMSTLRLGQFELSDFETLPTGECRFTDKARRRFLIEYQERKKDLIAHPLAAESIPYAMVPLVQARLLARAIRGEVEYVPFLLK